MIRFDGSSGNATWLVAGLVFRSQIGTNTSWHVTHYWPQYFRRRVRYLEEVTAVSDEQASALFQNKLREAANRFNRGIELLLDLRQDQDLAGLSEEEIRRKLAEIELTRKY